MNCLLFSLEKHSLKTVRIAITSYNFYLHNVIKVEIMNGRKFRNLRNTLRPDNTFKKKLPP